MTWQGEGECPVDLDTVKTAWCITTSGELVRSCLQTRLGEETSDWGRAVGFDPSCVTRSSGLTQGAAAVSHPTDYD